MDRAQFMEQLKRLLSDIPDGERQEALDYYENYFDDAGAENEAAVIRELGSPGKVAAIIKADLNEGSERYAQYTEQGYRDTREQEESRSPEKYRRDSSSGERQNHARDGYHPRPKRNASGIILLLILLVFLSPLIFGGVGTVFGLLGTVAGLLIGIIFLPLLVMLAIGGVVLGLLAGGGACIGVGVGLCFSYLAAGILTIGIGCLMMAGGFLFLALLVWLAGSVLPRLLRLVTDFCGKLLHRGGKDGAEV